MNENSNIAIDIEESKGLKGIKVDKKSLMSKLKGLSTTLYLLPTIILMLMFSYYPAAKTFMLSLYFTNAQGRVVKFAGLYNFRQLLSDSTFHRSLQATGTFTVITVILSIVISFFLAVIANEKLKGIGFFRTIFSSSLGVSGTAASVAWLFMFNYDVGFLNNLFRFFGLEAVDWLTNPNIAIFSVAIVSVWLRLGFNILIILAGMSSINESIYESAEIDGAGYFSKLFKITVPLLKPTFFYLMVINITKSLQEFGIVHVLTGGGPINSTRMLVYDVWSQAFVSNRFDMAATRSVVVFFITFVVTAIQFKLKGSEENE